jgi:hypothetical protein
MKLCSLGKGIHPMNSSMHLTLYLKAMFPSPESVEKSLSKRKLKRETKQLVSPFKVDRAGQIEHGFSTSPIAVFGRYS